ncbi:MAG: glycosyltransferase family 87 protein [Blastocatellia bacterium]
MDLGIFQATGRAWVGGIYQSNVIPGLPPYAVVLFAPLSLLSYTHLKLVWLLLNLAAASLCVFLAIKLVGQKWPAEARYFLAAFLLLWAPFRVTIRDGQISLMITALLLGALLARKRERKWLAGALLGFALCKYPLSFAFLLYFIWLKEWTSVSLALLVPASLTQVFAYRLGISAVTVTGDYVHLMGRTFADNHPAFIGVTEIKPLLYSLMGGSEIAASIMTLTLSAAALISMLIAVARRPKLEGIHYAVLTFFTLWSLYHRVYDSVLCILPAAVLIGNIVQRRYTLFSLIGLTSLALLVVSIPGLLTVRLALGAETLSKSPIGFLGLHLERLLMFGMFCSFLLLLWNTPRREEES